MKPMTKQPLSKHIYKHICKSYRHGGECLEDNIHVDCYELPSDVFIYFTLQIREMVENKDSLSPD